MKQQKLMAAAMFAAAAFGVQSVLGAGFGIYEGSARGNALGTEVTADPASPSVIYNNAAAMTELEGTQVEVGLTAIRPQQTVITTTPLGTSKNYADSKWWTPPHAYVTHKVNDQLSAGVGVFSRYGLGVKYDNDWPGRYNIQKATIQSIDINPSVAFKVLDNLSLAAGVRAEWFDIELKQAMPTGVPFVEPDLQLNIDGDSWGVGYNLGAFYKATEWLSVGLSYDSRIKQEVEGNYWVIHPAGNVINEGGGDGDIKTPDIVRLGVSVQATENLKLNAGLVYTRWSSYKTLAMTFDEPVMGQIPSSVSKKDWKDVMRYQLGAEYALDETWALRAGYIYDETPDRDQYVDYIVPSNDRHLFSAGVGYKKSDFFCDLTYTYLLIRDRDVNSQAAGVLPGKFEDGDAHMVGVSVGYKL